MKIRERTGRTPNRRMQAARPGATGWPAIRPLPATIRAATLAAGSLGVLAPAAMALSLGELTVESRLGEPFSARLLARAPYEEVIEPGCVTVRAGASSSGLPGLPKARVEVEPRDGAYLLRIRTLRPVLEPALSLVLAADCPGAAPERREYTVLIDPADAVWAGRLPSQTATAPARSAASAPRARPAVPAPARAAATPERPAGKPGARPPPPTAVAAGAVETPASGHQTVRVQRGETLYGIVSRFNPEASRRDRWRLVEAVVAANRHVFPAGDANRLPVGAEIRIPAPLPPAAPAAELARAPAPAQPESPANAGLRILSADEEEKLRLQGSPLATAPVARDAASAPNQGAQAATEASAAPAEVPLARTEKRPPVAESAADSAAAGQAQAEAGPPPVIAELNAQLASAQSRIRALSEQIAQLDAQLTETRAAAVTVPPPLPPAPVAPPEPAPAAADASRWYPLGLLAIAGIPLAYLLGRAGRRRSQSADDALPLAAATRAEPHVAARVTPAGSVRTAAEPSTPVQASPQPDRRDPARPGPAPASAPELPSRPAAAQVEGAEGPLHRLLLEAELHLLFDQREEARYVLEQAVATDSGDRPDLRPWTMLFDLLRTVQDQAAFESYASRFQGRYNVASPLWERKAGAAAGGLAERFPHVLDRIVELWGTREGLRMLNGLLLDDRGGSRRGFEFEIGEEISFLRDLLDRRGLDPVAAGPAPDDRWSTTTLNLAQ